MLGPLEDTLRHGDHLPSADRERLDLAYRNSLRLLRLVNTLLDFSRIEAGRIQASYEPIDLSALTADLASAFRAAVEAAGMKLIVDCPPLEEPAYVDREMWEKVVFNLLSNAFKFTFEGEIEISLRTVGDTFELAVRDTGTGIPPEEVPHLFERFHRVQGARGRTYEGTGIGLALVQELVKLHGGDVSVDSEVDRGSTFTVTIPRGSAHLPAERIGAERTLATTSVRGEAYVEEVLRWLPNRTRREDIARSESSGLGTEWTDEARSLSLTPEPAVVATSGRILLADDNADMRDYVCRLLGQQYDVTAVGDGAEALRALRHERFDLVVADVMMPQMDGFALLAAVRADEQTRTLPVILLSARAGEEARVEGMEAGADDYLVKPFSARELLARVRAHLTIAHIRRGAEEALQVSYEAERAARAQAEAATADREQFLSIAAHELRTPITSQRGAAQILRRELDRGKIPEPERMRRMVDIIDQGAEKLGRLVAQLLDVSRLSAGKLEISRENADLVALVEQVAAQARATTREHDIKVRAPDELWADFDPLRIEQVVVNLVDNALKYGPEGGEVQIDVSVTGGSRIEVGVTDHGAGIPPEQRERIFERFYQVEESAHTTGMGLGLYVSQEIAQLHGGGIRVEAPPGGGTRFVLSLPMTAPTTADQVA
jgi:signal transduction histidine kinase